MLMRRNTCDAWYEVSPKILLCVSIYCVLVPVLAIRTASNCWLLALNVGVLHGSLHIVGKLHGCFILVKTCRPAHACYHS